MRIERVIRAKRRFVDSYYLFTAIKDDITRSVAKGREVEVFSLQHEHNGSNLVLALDETQLKPNATFHFLKSQNCVRFCNELCLSLLEGIV